MTLPDSAKWAQRLDQWKPWLDFRDPERGYWLPAWGLSPDSAGTNPLIPPAMLREWRTIYRAERSKRAGRAP